MKQFIYLLAFAFISVNASAQTFENVSIASLKVTKVENNIEITWTSDVAEDGKYWEVQASSDGKEFESIGMVLGADPKNEGKFAFKQAAKNIKPGYKYYRVACVNTDHSALASSAITLSK